MVSLETIEREIQELEARGETTYAQCERLAWLYVVRDHLVPTEGGSETTRELRGSEFLEAASGVPYDRLMAVLDEHMEAMRVVQGREYQRVLDAIKSLR